MSNQQIGKGYWQVRGEKLKPFIIEKYNEVPTKKIEHVKYSVQKKYREYISEGTIKNLLNEWGIM